MILLQFKRKCVLLKLSFVCKISKFCNFIISINIYFFLVEKDSPEPPTPLQHCVYAICCLVLNLVDCRVGSQNYQRLGGMSYLGKMYGKAGLLDLLCDASGFGIIWSLCQ